MLVHDLEKELSEFSWKYEGGRFSGDLLGYKLVVLQNLADYSGWIVGHVRLQNYVVPVGMIGNITGENLEEVKDHLVKKVRGLFKDRGAGVSEQDYVNQLAQDGLMCSLFVGGTTIEA